MAIFDMLHGKRRRGAVLLQTLVMSVIISMISVMVMQWVLMRYSTVTRMQKSTAQASCAKGYTGTVFARWNFNNGTVGPVSGVSMSPAGIGVTAVLSVQAIGGSNLFRIDVPDW